MGRETSKRCDFVFAAMVAFLLLTDSLGPATAAEWPQYRGPNRNNSWHETNLVEKLTILNVRWRKPISWGWSSPVVAQERVFISDAIYEGKSAREAIHCLDIASGRLLWEFSYAVDYPDWAFTAGQEGGPCATPIVEGERLYVLGANGQVHCLKTSNGAIAWAKNLRDDYTISDWTCRASPLLEGNLLILFTGAKPGACLLALNKMTGAEVWRTLDEPVSNSSPIVIQAAGRRQLIVWTDKSVTSLNPTNGESYWREPLVTASSEAIATPVAKGDLLLVGGLMFRLHNDAPGAEIIWPASKAPSQRILSNTSTAALLGDFVYSGKSTGQLVCLEAESGKARWEADALTDLKNGASIHITLASDAAFLFTDKGDLIQARLRPEGYEELGRIHLIEPTYPFGDRKCVWSPPAYASQCIFARSDREIVCASLAREP